MDVQFDVPALATSLALIAGAVIAGLLARNFVLRRPNLAGLGRSLLGGTIMGFGGTLIPGGNDSLLLAAIPGGTLSGITAFLVMSLTVPLLLWVAELRLRLPGHPKLIGHDR
jgi:hypothetical protein